jgi:hypothetical protein
VTGGPGDAAGAATLADALELALRLDTQAVRAA